MPNVSSGQEQRHVLPKDLPNAVKHLGDDELDRLVTIALAETKRRGRSPPGARGNTAVFLRAELPLRHRPHHPSSLLRPRASLRVRPPERATDRSGPLPIGNSIFRFRPSTKPVSFKPCRFASKNRVASAAAMGLRNPATGTEGCCALAASGHAVAPPRNDMNLRRCIRISSPSKLTGNLHGRGARLQRICGPSSTEPAIRWSTTGPTGAMSECNFARVSSSNSFTSAPLRRGFLLPVLVVQAERALLAVLSAVRTPAKTGRVLAQCDHAPWQDHAVMKGRTHQTRIRTFACPDDHTRQLGSRWHSCIVVGQSLRGLRAGPAAGWISRSFVVRKGVHRCFGAIAPRVARGLKLRHDHGSNSMSGDYQDEFEFLGIEASPSQGNGAWVLPSGVPRKCTICRFIPSLRRCPAPRRDRQCHGRRR